MLRRPETPTWRRGRLLFIRGAFRVDAFLGADIVEAVGGRPQGGPQARTIAVDERWRLPRAPADIGA